MYEFLTLLGFPYLDATDGPVYQFASEKIPCHEPYEIISRPSRSVREFLSAHVHLRLAGMTGEAEHVYRFTGFKFRGLQKRAMWLPILSDYIGFPIALSLS